MNLFVNSIFKLLFVSNILFLSIYCTERRYNVHMLEGPTTIERVSSGVLDINCYVGKPKSLTQIWKTVKLTLNIVSDRFNQYQGYTPEDVWKAYIDDQSLFSTNFFTSKKSKVIRIHPFNNTCIAIKTDENHTITLDVLNVDHWKVGLFFGGLILFIYSRSLGENVMFFYLSGISLGVFASFMILVYFLSKMLPGRPVVYSAMIGGWTLGVYALQFLWSNFRPLLIAYHTYVAWYVAISGIISFIICYKMGPPKDQRNKNLITWTLQAVGLGLMYFSTEILEAFAGTTLVLMVIKGIPTSWFAAFKRRWRLKYPKKRVLLTEEEYHEQGVKETKKALDDLMGYCSSPECPQWKLMLKLKNPQKFANFMENKVHLSDEEISEYDNDIVIRRKNISNHFKPSNKAPIRVEDLTSDDSSFSSDDS